jgi:hypothetical protein
MGVLGPDEVQFLAGFGLDHLALEEVVVFKLSVGRVMRVDEDGVGLDLRPPGFPNVLQTAHPIVILKDIVERRILVDKDVDSLIAHELHLLPLLPLHLLPTHGQYLRTLPLPRPHPPVKILTHRHTLQLHINLPQQIVSSHLLVYILKNPRLSQQLIGKIFSLHITTLHQKYSTDKFVKLKFDSALEFEGC